MIKLISLSFCGIGRFVEKQSINFSDRDRLLQIDGRNENTGGSSGSGKSTVFHALDYLLGINDVPSTVLQSRLTKNPISVEAEFEIDGKKVKISRSKKDGLAIDVDGEITSGNSKLAEEQLDRLIGIPKKIFKKMIHKKQKEGGFFLNLTAKESYDFLTKALGLEDLTIKVELIDQNIKKIKEEIVVSEKHKSLVESSLLSVKNDLEQFNLFSRPSKEDILNLEKEIEVLKKEIEIKNNKLIEKVKELDSSKPIKQTNQSQTDELKKIISKIENDKFKLEDQKNQSLDILKNNRTNILHDIKSIESKLSKIPYIKNQLSKIASDVKSYMEQKSHIEKSQCPTCMQLWAGNSAQEKIGLIQNSILSLKKDASDLCIQLEDEGRLNQSLKNQNNILSDCENDIKKIESEFFVKISNLNLEISEARNRILNIEKDIENKYLNEINNFNLIKNKTIEEISSDIYRTKDILNNLSRDLDSKKNEENIYQKSLQMQNILNNKLSEHSLELNNIKINLEELYKKVNIAEESKRLIKSYSLQKFQETLECIGDTASDILRNVPNMSTASIYFEGRKETNSGTIKEEVTAFVSIDGEPDIDIKSLSGGERTSIDLAVDLAVIDVLETKAGKGADFFILDEPFDGLDSISRAAIIDIVKSTDSNKRIIIVDHGTETKEIISDIITIVRTNETSCVV